MTGEPSWNDLKNITEQKNKMMWQRRIREMTSTLNPLAVRDAVDQIMNFLMKNEQIQIFHQQML